MENRKIKSRCIFRYENKILLCHNEEYNYYFFPGGSAEANESPTEILTREIKEEFGSEIKDIKIISTMNNVGENLDETITMFQANFVQTDLYQQPSIALLDLPEVKAKWVYLEDIKNNEVKIFPEHDYLSLIQ